MDHPPDKPLPVETRNDHSDVGKSDSFIDELLSAKAVYVLYLAGLLTGGITALIGVVIAYVQRGNINQGTSDQSTEWELSHYEYQIRTFWIGFLYMAVGTLLMAVLIGIFVWLFWLLWLVIRCVKGLQLSSEQKPIPNPKDWWFS